VIWPFVRAGIEVVNGWPVRWMPRASSEFALILSAKNHLAAENC
jgi:hypothetical protein